MNAPVAQVKDHIDFTSEHAEGHKAIRVSSVSGRYRCADQSSTNQRPAGGGVGFGEQVGPEIEAELALPRPGGGVGVPPGLVARSGHGVYAVSSVRLVRSHCCGRSIVLRLSDRLYVPLSLAPCVRRLHAPSAIQKTFIPSIRSPFKAAALGKSFSNEDRMSRACCACSRRPRQPVGKRGISTEAVSQHGGDQLHEAYICRVCATVGVDGVYQPG